MVLSLWLWHYSSLDAAIGIDIKRQTKLRVKSSKLIIDKAVPKTNSAISFFFQENITFHWHFPEILVSSGASPRSRSCSNLLLHITVFENYTKKSHFSTLIWWRLAIIPMTKDNDGWTSFLFDGHCPSNQWTKIMVDELHFCLMADRVWLSKTFLVISKHCELDMRCFIIHFRCCWKIKIKHVTYASLSFFLPYLMVHPFSRPN